MYVTEIFELVIKKDYDLVLTELEKLHPRSILEFVNTFARHGKDAYDDFVELLNEEQRKKFKWLGSSEREKQYLLTIAEQREMTEQEWHELKACDF